MDGSILVAGGAGFVGQRLVAALQQKRQQVRLLTRQASAMRHFHPTLDFAVGDVRDYDSLRLACAGIRVIFHLAGHAHAWRQGDAGLHENITVGGTANLLRAAAEAGVRRFVFFSSVKAGGGGGAPEKPGLDVPTDDYGRARRVAEALVLEAGRRHGLHVCNLRLAMVYGVGMKGNLPRMIEGIAGGRFPPWPRGANRRSMVWVEDVVRAALLATTRPEANGKTYVVTDGEAYSTRRIYEAICCALGKPVPHWSVPMPVLRGIALVGDAIGAVRRKRFVFDSEALEKLAGSAWYSSRAIEEELGFTPTKRLEDVLPEIVATIGSGVRRPRRD